MLLARKHARVIIISNLLLVRCLISPCDDVDGKTPGHHWKQLHSYEDEAVLLNELPA